MHAPLILEAHRVKTYQYTETPIEVADILVDWPWLWCSGRPRFRTLRRLGSSIGNEHKDVSGRYEGGHAQEADELDLKQA